MPFLKKNHRANLEKRRFTFWMMGLIVGLGSVLMAFEYTTYKDYNGGCPPDPYIIDWEDELPPTKREVDKPEPKVTTKEKSAGIKPEPSYIDIVPSTSTTETEEPEPLEIGGEYFPEESTANEEPIGFMEADEWPSLGDCRENTTNFKKFECTEGKILKFFARKVRYPGDALSIKKGGTVHISFVINGEGKVQDVRLLNKVHPSLDKEAMNAVKALPKFNPGKQRGKPVSVRYRASIAFRAE